MSENTPKQTDLDPLIFDLESIFSGDVVKKAEMADDVLGIADLAKAVKPENEPSPVEKELASTELPPLERENRARLQMQTPNRLYFYWSMKNNPFQTLERAFGHPGSYQLVTKLVNLTRDTEEMHPVDAEGNYWFNVDSDAAYRAEIGFYAPNRPYVRAMFSNTVETPRKRPSPRVATSQDWKVSARGFAEVLDASGFKRDAYDVAVAGDRPQAIDYSAVANYLERDHSEFAGIKGDELRFALLLLAAGFSIEDLRHRIDATLFAVLQANAGRLTKAGAQTALKGQFGIDAEEIFEEETGAAVFGLSLVNFPKSIKKRRHYRSEMPEIPELSDLSEYAPVSS